MSESKDAQFSVVIVTYYPGQRLLRNLDVLNNCACINDIFIIDNTGEDSRIINSTKKYSKVKIVRNEKNEGIGRAQNEGIKLSEDLGYKWVLTFDHDTVAKPSLIEKYSEFIISGVWDDIAIVNSDYIEGTGVGKDLNIQEPTYVTETISSGSLINIHLFNIIGKFAEDFFIDQVDNEYCYRVIKSGYKIVILPGKDMEHQMGNMTYKRFMGHTFVLYNQSPIRTYYRTRNIVLMLKKYKDKNLFVEKFKDLCHDFIRIAFEKDALKKYKCYFQGLIFGLKK